MDFLSEGFLFLIKHLEESGVLKFALNIWIFGNISTMLDEDVESSGAITLLGKLNLIIIFIVCAVCQQDLYNFDKQFTDTVNELMRGLEVFFKYNPAILDNFVIEHEFSFHRVVC